MSSLYRLPSDQIQSKVKNENNCENVSTNESLVCNDFAFGKSIESLHVLSDEQVVIASSNLFGPQMSGFVTKYKSISDVPQMPFLSLNLSYGGICNLIGMRNNCMVCGFDSGHISLLNSELEEQVSVIYHDSQISRININKLQTKIVSCGYDSNIFIIDLDTFMATKNYAFAHSSYIWDVVFNPIDDNMLISCGKDRNVLLWDLRQSKPATKLVTLKSEPTALLWSSKDISNSYIGSSSGELMLFDVRHPGREISVINSCSQKIYRLKAVNNGNGIAICADSNIFQVYNSELIECIYEDKTSHSDWIRSVFEHNKLLYTTGRDTRLVCHVLQNTEL